MNMYANDLYTITITPSSRPRTKQTLKFFKVWPGKADLLKAIDIAITNGERAARSAAEDDDYDSNDGQLVELSHWQLCRQVVELLPALFQKQVQPYSVGVAGTQIGVLNFETEEVYEFEA